MIGLTSRFEVYSTTHGFLLQVAVVPGSYLSHIVALFVGWVVAGLILGRAVVLEEGGAQSGDGQAADQDDHDDSGGGDGHVVRRESIVERGT